MAGELQARLGANVRAHRRQLNMSQEAFAYEVGVHRTLMGAIERGERNLTLRSVEKLAESLGMDPADLLRPAAGERPDRDHR